MMRRTALATAAVALLAVVPAAAHEPRPRTPAQQVRGGFSFTAAAGSQALVRLMEPLELPAPRHDPRTTLRASKGPVAGFALLGVYGTSAWGHTVQVSLPSGTARDVGTSSTSGLRLPPGYDRLLLMGAPGARVEATVRPYESFRSPTRVTAVRQTGPSLVDVSGVAAGTGADVVGTGATDLPPTSWLSYTGVVHYVRHEVANGFEWTHVIGHGAPGGGRCVGPEHQGSTVPYSPGPALEPAPMVWTAASFDYADPDDTCAAWRGVVRAARAEQRAWVVHVPLFPI